MKLIKAAELCKYVVSRSERRVAQTASLPLDRPWCSIPVSVRTLDLQDRLKGDIFATKFSLQPRGLDRGINSVLGKQHQANNARFCSNTRGEGCVEVRFLLSPLWADAEGANADRGWLSALQGVLSANPEVRRIMFMAMHTSV